MAKSLSSPEDLEQFISSAPGHLHSCTLCSYTKTKTLVRNHVESIHFPKTFTYRCSVPDCEKVFWTNNAFQMHRKRNHR